MRYPFDTGRLWRVIEMAATEAGWGRSLPDGHGLGIAAHRSFLSSTAVVVEAAISNEGRLTIPRVDIAFDCGAVVNPDRVRSPLEGAVVFGVSLAPLGEISFKAGRVEQSNFHDYEVTRIDASPREIRTHLVSATGYDKPLGGVGEPGLRRSRRPLPTRSTGPQASACARCQFGTSSHSEREPCRRLASPGSACVYQQAKDRRVMRSAG